MGKAGTAKERTAKVRQARPWQVPARDGAPRRLAGLCACLLAAAGLAACAKSPAPEADAPSRLSCERLYTRAPGYLVVELAAGSDIFLTPTAQPFPVHCTPEDAHRALLLDASSGKIPRGDWQIYALNGGSELACVQDGRDILCKPAKIVEWAPHEPVVPQAKGVPVAP